MASRMANLWRTIGNSRRFTTSTAPKMKAFAPTATDFPGTNASKPRGEFVPVYAVLGLITLSVSFGLYTAEHELAYAPNVLVRKKKRETVPEVEDPDWAAQEAELFFRTSIFRKVAHLQESDADLARAKLAMKVDTLKSVGVDPRGH